RTRFFQVGTWRSGRPAILPNGAVAKWEPKPGTAKAVHALVEDLCLSMSSEDHLDLPPVVHNRVDITLPPKVRRVYEELRKNLAVDLDDLGVPTHTAANAAVLAGRLQQVSAGFLYNHDDLGLPLGTWRELHR